MYVTQAAIRAGYSEKTAQGQSSRLLLNVMVQEAIQKAMKERSERTKNADKCLPQVAYRNLTKPYIQFYLKTCH